MIIYTYLPGSASSAYDDLEWINKLVAYIAKISATKPECKLFGEPHTDSDKVEELKVSLHTLGICFGHQIIARALGGECVPNNGKWEVGISEVELTELGQQIFGRQVLVKVLRTLKANIAHALENRIFNRCIVTMSRPLRPACNSSVPTLRVSIRAW
jgi:GMP synthase-like glutamine amidotransferase